MLGDDETAVADHYTVNGLGKRILDALQASGVNLDTLSPVILPLSTSSTSAGALRPSTS